MSTINAKKRPADTEGLVECFEALAIKVSDVDELLPEFGGLAISGDHGLESLKKRRKAEVPKFTDADQTTADSTQQTSSPFEFSRPKMVPQPPTLDGPFKSYAYASNRLSRLANTKKRSDWISKRKPQSSKSTSKSSASDPLAQFRPYDPSFRKNTGWSRLLGRPEPPIGSQHYVPLATEPSLNLPNTGYNGHCAAYSPNPDLVHYAPPSRSVSLPPASKTGTIRATSELSPFADYPVYSPTAFLPDPYAKYNRLSASDLSPEPHPCRPVYKPKHSQSRFTRNTWDNAPHAPPAPLVPHKARKTIYTPEGFKEIEYIPEPPRPGPPRSEPPTTGPPSYGPISPSSRWRTLTMPKVPTKINTRSGRVLQKSNPRMTNLLEAWMRMLSRLDPNWRKELTIWPWELEMAPEELIKTIKAQLHKTELDEEEAEWLRCEEADRMQRDREQWRQSAKEERTLEMMEDMALTDVKPQLEASEERYECIDASDKNHVCHANCLLMLVEKDQGNHSTGEQYAEDQLC